MPKTISNKTLEEFKKDRNEAILSLDKEKILAFGKKHHIRFSSDENVFWLSIHKAITGCIELPKDFRIASKKYLEERGSISLDDGDL